jgi:hypothetical protein
LLFKGGTSLSKSEKAAVKDTELLLKIARHKEVFFPAA